MPEALTLENLLSRSDAPSASWYKGVSSSVIENPEQISDLVSATKLNETLVYLRSRSPRVVRLFHALLEFQRHKIDCPAKQNIADRIAKAAVAFLLATHTSLATDLPISSLVDLLRSTIAISLTLNPPSALRQLARDLTRHLGCLACYDGGGKIINQWVHSTVFHIQDCATVAAWTDILIAMITCCPDYHGEAKSVDEWKVICSTRTTLSAMAQKLEQQAPKAITDTRMLGTSTDEANADVNTALIASAIQRFPDLTVNYEICEALRLLELEIPRSERSLANVIEAIEGEKTLM